MAKLLIAARSESLSSALAEALTQYEVYNCHTGVDALVLLESLRPDIFIVDLSLPVISGLAVLQETHYKPPVILALTNLVTERILQSAIDTGVQHILLQPCAVRHIISHLEAQIQKNSTLDS